MQKLFHLSVTPVVWLLVLAFLLPRVQAQTGTSFTLQGTVQDSTGAVLPNAVVTIKNLSLGLTRTV